MLDIFVECPECGGEGRCEYEVPVIDYDNGGYLKGEWQECHKCHGLGEVQSEEN